LLLLALILLGACSKVEGDTTARDESGVITEGGEVGVLALKVGDCLNDPTVLDLSATEPSEVEAVAAVPCEETHTGEVVLVDDEFFAAESEYPGDEVIQSRSYEACVKALEEYTGKSYADSPIDTFPYTPTEDGWANDDRGIICVGVVLSETTMYPIESTGSMKAAA
jgi:hypothetical protein